MRKALAFAVLLVAATAEAGTRLTYQLNGQVTPIYWPSFPVSFQVSQELRSRIPETAPLVPRAFDAWATVSESSVRFTDAGMVSARAGRDDKNVIAIADDLFSSSGFIAYTTNWFDDRGRIFESDIQIDASAAKAGTNLAALLEHEIGHFLGLDHSAVLSSVMFPYVGADNLGGLDSDDRVTIATMYPAKAIGEFGGTLRGEVRDGNGGVFGAQVVAMDHQGSPVVTILTDASGRFELQGVPQGDYTLYVEPLDGPVEAKNLSGVWRTGGSPFRTEFMAGQAISVRTGVVKEGITLRLDSRPVSLNPRWIGVFPENSSDIHLSATASKIRPGETICIAVGGDGFLSGVTQFEVLSSGISRISDFRYGQNYLWATFKIAPDTPAGSINVRVANGDESTALTGAMRVERVARTRSVRR